MKLSIITLTLALLSLHAANAFVSQSTARPIITSLAGTVELVAEPDGGEELTATKTMAGSRMKNMGEAKGVTDDKGRGTVYKFWLTATAEGTLIKDISNRILKDAAKKANFPGFRKVWTIETVLSSRIRLHARDLTS